VGHVAGLNLMNREVRRAKGRRGAAGLATCRDSDRVVRLTPADVSISDHPGKGGERCGSTNTLDGLHRQTVARVLAAGLTW
jgi:hypothetical protein